MANDQARLRRLLVCLGCAVAVIALLVATSLYVGQRGQYADDLRRRNHILSEIRQYAIPIEARLAKAEEMRARPDINGGSLPLHIRKKSSLPMPVFQVVRTDGRVVGAQLTDVLDETGNRWFLGAGANSLGRSEREPAASPEAVYEIIRRAKFGIIRDGLPYQSRWYGAPGQWEVDLHLMEVKYTIFDLQTLEPSASISFRQDGTLPDQITAVVGREGKTRPFKYDLNSKINPWSFDLLMSFVEKSMAMELR